MILSFSTPQSAEFDDAFTETALSLGQVAQIGAGSLALPEDLFGPAVLSPLGRHCSKQLTEPHGSDDIAMTCPWIPVAFCGMYAQAFLATARTPEVDQPSGK